MRRGRGQGGDGRGHLVRVSVVLDPQAGAILLQGREEEESMIAEGPALVQAQVLDQ